MNEDEIKGVAKNTVGKVKDAAGGLTGSPGLQAEGKIDQGAGKIQGQYGEAKDQLSDVAGTIADKAATFADKAGSTLRDAAQTMRHQAGQASEAVYGAGAQAGEYVGRTVKQQPLLSLIGTAAIGYAIGFLLHSPLSPLTPKPTSRRYFR